MRAVSVVPIDVQRDRPPEGAAILRNQQSPRTLPLHGPDEAHNQSDAPMFADRGEALRDDSTATPPPESTASELFTLIANQVARRDSSFADCALSEGTRRLGGRLLQEGPEADDASGLMIDDDREPPAERPRCGRATGSAAVPHGKLSELTVHALRRPALGQGQGGSGETDDLNDRRTNTTGPA
jgi:hypothetical protein